MFGAVRGEKAQVPSPQGLKGSSWMRVEATGRASVSAVCPGLGSPGEASGAQATLTLQATLSAFLTISIQSILRK